MSTPGVDAPLGSATPILVPSAPAAPEPGTDGLDPTLVLNDTGQPALHLFNRAGILDAADIHAAVRLGRLAGETDETVLLATALAVRAPRMGHVSVDLRQVRSSVVVVGAEDSDLDALPWPDPGPWLEAVAASPLVAAESGGPGDLAEAGADGDGVRPLRLVGASLYLDRYWRDQQDVAAELLDRAAGEGTGAGRGVGEPATGGDLAGVLDRLFPDGDAGDQRRAAETALSGRLAVIAGGPGTGKTTTVARLLVALFEQAESEGGRPPLVALAAPTGKAAARMEEAVRAEAARVAVSASVRRELESVRGSTIHRLLGSRPDRVSRFRHHAGHRLPHDVVVVDEASMVPLSLMARLVEAVRRDARLVLVGDPEQLVSVEAGAVLADIAGPVLAAAGSSAAEGSGAGASAAAAPSAGAAGADGPGVAAPAASPGRTLDGCVVALRHNHRFSGALADLAEAVRAGDPDAAVAALRSRSPGVAWIEVQPEQLLFEDGESGSDAGTSSAGTAGTPAADTAKPDTAVTDAADWRAGTVEWAMALVERARRGDAAGAATALASHRILCAHRRGGAGVAAWNGRVERWLAAVAPDMAGEGAWYAGRPVMVTANDYSIRLFNGDTGVTVATPRAGAAPVAGAGAAPAAAPAAGADDAAGPPPSGPLRPGPPAGAAVAFPGLDGGIRLVSPYRLAQAETVFAMTVHKSQGSEFDRVTVLLPPASSRLLTRELLYTALTRARSAITVVGPEDALRAAVTRPMERASGLGPLLWGGNEPR